MPLVNKYGRPADFRVNLQNPDLLATQLLGQTEAGLKQRSAEMAPDFSAYHDLLLDKELHSADRMMAINQLNAANQQFFEAFAENPDIMFSPEGRSFRQRLDRIIGSPRLAQQEAIYKSNEETRKRLLERDQLDDIVVGDQGNPIIIGGKPATYREYFDYIDQSGALTGPEGQPHNLLITQNPMNEAVKNIRENFSTIEKSGGTQFQSIGPGALLRTIAESNAGAVQARLGDLVENGFNSEDLNAIRSNVISKMDPSQYNSQEAYFEDLDRRTLREVASIAQAEISGTDRQSMIKDPRFESVLANEKERQVGIWGLLTDSVVDSPNSVPILGAKGGVSVPANFIPKQFVKEYSTGNNLSVRDSGVLSTLLIPGKTVAAFTSKGLNRQGTEVVNSDYVPLDEDVLEYINSYGIINSSNIAAYDLYKDSGGKLLSPELQAAASNADPQSLANYGYEPTRVAQVEMLIPVTEEDGFLFFDVDTEFSKKVRDLEPFLSEGQIIDADEEITSRYFRDAGIDPKNADFSVEKFFKVNISTDIKDINVSLLNTAGGVGNYGPLPLSNYSTRVGLANPYAGGVSTQEEYGIE